MSSFRKAGLAVWSKEVRRWDMSSGTVGWGLWRVTRSMKRLLPQSHRLSYSQELGRHFFLSKLLPGENRQTPGFTFHRAVIPRLECGSSTSSPIWSAFPVSILLLPSTFPLTGLTGLFIAPKYLWNKYPRPPLDWIVLLTFILGSYAQGLICMREQRWSHPDRSARPHMAHNIWKFQNVRITIPVAWMKNTSFKDVKALG